MFESIKIAFVLFIWIFLLFNFSSSKFKMEQNFSKFILSRPLG